MKALISEIKAVKSMLEYIIEYVIGIEEPEEWEKRMIEKALKEETLDEEELWKSLGLKLRREP